MSNVNTNLSILSKALGSVTANFQSIKDELEELGFTHTALELAEMPESKVRDLAEMAGLLKAALQEVENA